MNTSNLFSVIIWGSFIISMPMLAVAWIIEGPEQIVNSLHHLTWKGAGALMYTVYLSTWLGYGVWNWLLGKYPVSVVVPFTLLIPVVGMVSSVFIFGEPFQLWKLNACLLVIGGLCINILSSRFTRLKAVPGTA
jgi:O-acetylserine/cysteine efflux transporter